MRAKIHRVLSSGIIIWAMVLSNSTIAQAGWIQEPSKQVTANTENTAWKYQIGNTPQYVTGDFIDINGEIYKFDSEGLMETNTQASYGRYYGSDGKLQNVLDKHIESKDTQTENFLAKNKVTFTDKAQAQRWKRYYDYCISETGGLNVVLGITDEGYVLNGSKYSIANSPQVEQTIITLSQNIRADTVEQTVANACKAVSNYLEYDISCVTLDAISLEDVCQTQKAICLGYARLTKEILHRAGVESEMVYGSADNSLGFALHCWLRTDINQWNNPGPGEAASTKWMFSDPTWFDSSLNTKYINIDYKEYLSRYMMKGV